MDIAFEVQRERDRERELVWALGLSILVLLLLASLEVAAGDGYSRGNLTDLFSTDAFSGNWEVFTKMNWIGKIMSWTISAFSLIGLFTVGMKVMLTMLYLSGKNFWDNVDEIKSAGKNHAMFGVKELFNGAYNAKYGTGLDAVISFFFGLFPNVKAYSEYAADAKHKNNFAETDTVMSYLLKSAIPNIMTIFAFTMGFNGVLWQAYGTVVEAMGVAAQNFADTNLSALVDRAINTGSNYQFAYNADGTKYGDFKQTVAKKIYTSLLKNTTNLSSEVKVAIGSKIDTQLSDTLDMMGYLAATAYVDENGDRVVSVGKTLYKMNGSVYAYASGDASVTKAYAGGSNGWGTSLTTIAREDGKSWGSYAAQITDAQARNLTYSVVVNNSDSYNGALSVPATDLGFADDGTSDGESLYYVHIFITKKANSDEHNYMSISDDLMEFNTGTSSKNGKTGGQSGDGNNNSSRDQM